MKNTNWKVPVIIGVGVLAVILMIVFGVQSSQNKAIALEEQVNTASSDIKSKLEVSGLKKEECDLKKMESKLDKLLSDDKKTELEIDEIAALLK